MESGEAYLKRNGHMVRHRYDVALKWWVPAEPIPERAPKPFRPMLAKTYAGELTFPVLAQPKIDGVRCIARASGLFSRDGNRFESCAHIEETLARLFLADPALVLDGELHAEGHTLGEVAGLARRSAPAASLCFHAFDIVGAERAEERATALADLIGPFCGDAVALVPTTVCASEADLDEHYRSALAEGFEGQMIRLSDAAYGRGRVPVLLKRKPTEDDEAEIVGFVEGDGGNVSLSLRWKDGRSFVAPAPRRHADRARITRIGPALVGLEATYRWSGVLPTGLPRDPVVRLIHEFPRL